MEDTRKKGNWQDKETEDNVDVYDVWREILRKVSFTSEKIWVGDRKDVWKTWRYVRNKNVFWNKIIWQNE